MDEASVIAYKVCRKCGGPPQSIAEFYRNLKLPGGRIHICRTCIKAAAAKWQKEHPEKRRVALQRYREANPESIRESQHKFAVAHPGRTLEIKRKSAAKHQDKIKAKRIAYYQEHRQEILARSAAWQKNNPRLVGMRKRRRQARELDAPVSDFTHAQWVEMQAFYDHRCAYCLKRFKGKLCQEHITPLSKGGSNTLNNIVPACRSCNSKKRSGPPLRPVQPMLLTVAQPIISLNLFIGHNPGK